MLVILTCLSVLMCFMWVCLHFQSTVSLVIQLGCSVATLCQIIPLGKTSLQYLGFSSLLLQVSRSSTTSFRFLYFTQKENPRIGKACKHSNPAYHSLLHMQCKNEVCVDKHLVYILWFAHLCVCCRGYGRLQHELRPSATWTQHPRGNTSSCLHLVRQPPKSTKTYTYLYSAVKQYLPSAQVLVFSISIKFTFKCFRSKFNIRQK